MFSDYRGTSEDTMNFVPWDRCADMGYEIQSMTKFVGDDVVPVLTLDKLLEGEDFVDPKISHIWLMNWLDILNGTSMTPGNPGFKGYSAKHKMRVHWKNYARLREKLLKELGQGSTEMTREQIEQQYQAQCQFSLINDNVEKNFLVRAFITKTLRRNGVTVIWHTTSPQTWSSELRRVGNGLSRVNPEVMTLPEWEKFRKDFKLESYMTNEHFLYMHMLDEVTMFHTAFRTRHGKGATFNVEKEVYIPTNDTDEQKNFVDGHYRQCDLVCSDMEVIAIQNDTKLPVNEKLVYLDGDDHLISRLASLGVVLPNYFKNRKKYDAFCKIEVDNCELKETEPLVQLSKAQEEDRLHMQNVYLSTQVDDVKKEPSKRVRIPIFEKRKERARLNEQRRQRLGKQLAKWQVNEQLAKEAQVFKQVASDPKPRFSSVMPQNWTVQSAFDDIRAFQGYQKLYQESKPHFEQVKKSSIELLF